MSRIEQALEKAAKLRDVNLERTGRPDHPPESPTPSPQASPHAFISTEIPLEITNPTLVAATNPQSPMAEEYRKLKEMVIKLTINLAISLAQEYDHTVLLIDADLRRPSVEKYLGLGPRPGLAECLLDGAAVPDLLIKTGIGKLVVLPSGRATPNPGELFSSSKMRGLIKEMKHRYADRYVIIDTPPVLPFAETRTLSTIVDEVILVVKSGLSTLENIKDAVEAMRGASMLGLVYNNAPPDSLGSSYSHYHYGYGYGTSG